MTAREGFAFYKVVMREDGGLVKIKSSKIADSEPGERICSMWDSKTYCLFVNRTAKSEKAVIKIANEIRTQRIATLGWPKYVVGPNPNVGGYNPSFEIDEPDTRSAE